MRAAPGVKERPVSVVGQSAGGNEGCRGRAGGRPPT